MNEFVSVNYIEILSLFPFYSLACGRVHHGVARKPPRYTLIFVGITVVGGLPLLPDGGDIVKWFNGD